MAISFSRPDPSSAASVSSAQFPTSRRGFDQAEVRDFLRMVAAELARLQERERFLERELRSAQHPGSSDAVTMDDDTATRLLGEEAARVLQTAREAATQIRARAEDGSARLLREATDEAQRLREEAEIESARRRQDAASDAEAEVQMAKQQGRDMVNEARAYRERVLSELARRRELARQQLEQLIHGRDRLLQAFERSRLAAVDVMAELTPLGEPVEYVNLQPTTGPVPLMVPATSMYMQPDRDDDDLDLDQVAQTEVEVAEVEIEIEIVELDIEIEVAEVELEVEADVFGEADDDTIGLQLVESHDDTVVSLPEPAPFDDRNDNNDREPARVVSLFAKTSDRAETKPTSSVDDLFARLRESRADTVVERAVIVEVPAAEVEDEEAESQTESGVDTVAEAVVPLILSASRKLKRVLADEQNELLDLLRRKEPVRTLDDLLPWEADQSARYSAAVEKDLVAAAVAGAQGGSDGRNPAIVRPAIDAVTNDIISPLRDRLTRSIDKAAGVNSDLANEVRGIYREWKAHRIDEYVEEIVRLAYDRGALTVTPG
ncbi:MAG: DivIVA domain-containing protein [Actinomycetota bacterium]